MFNSKRFKPYANELNKGIKDIFDLNNEYQKGYKAFLFAMNKIAQLEVVVRNKKLEGLF